METGPFRNIDLTIVGPLRRLAIGLGALLDFAELNGSNSTIWRDWHGLSMKMFGKHRLAGRLFIVEGIDGSGKSTQLSLLKKWLESEGYVVYFSEWNSSPLVHDVTKRGKKKRC